MARVERIAAFVGCILIVAGCGSDRSADQPAPVLYQAKSESLLARLTGRLELRGPCIVVVDRLGQVWTVAWPMPGTHWEPEVGTGVIGIGTEVAAIGSMVTLGGGAGNESGAAETSGSGLSSAQNEAWIQPPAPECRKYKFWIAAAILPNTS